MGIKSYRYPQRPTNVDENITKPTDQFRREVVGVVRSIIGFILTYLTLVIGALALAVLCVLAAYWVITYMRNLWMLMFGIALIGFGCAILYFLFKFVFKRKKIDRSRMIEITSEDQPVLFDFLKRVAAETDTRLPKRVYISSDVTASVFFDSSFWSMFLPARKNLNIGLGLVNCVDVSEFKSVIAHEFGHFSQSSMKLGSYVYHVNHILHDMLFDSNDYDRSIEAAGNYGGYGAFFSALTGFVVEIIRAVLQSSYTKINKRFMALSRQMEFHADAVAASVSGSSPLIHALYRIDVAGDCYNDVIGYCNFWANENRKVPNIYPYHTTIMNNFAEAHHLPITHGLVQVSSKSFERYNKTRVIITDQWASHPSMDERELHLNLLNITCDTVTDSAWSLFTNVEQLQQESTDLLYVNIGFQGKPALVDHDSFHSLLHDIQERNFRTEYRGFYDHREMTPFDPVAIVQQKSTDAKTFDDILTEKTLGLPYLINGLTADMKVLEELDAEGDANRTFDFEGRKYGGDEASLVLLQLKQELSEATAALEKADQEMFLLFFKRSTSASRQQKALELYREMFALSEKTRTHVSFVNSMIEETGQLFQTQLTEGIAIAVTNNMKRKSEVVKKMILAMFEDEGFLPCYSANDKKTLLAFVDDHHKYFLDTGFDFEAIDLYMQALNLYRRIITHRNSIVKRTTLETQAKVIGGELGDQSMFHIIL